MSHTIGVLSFQGDFEKHLTVFSRLGCDVLAVRRPDQIGIIDGLVIPGGESTTIGLLMQRFGLLEAVEEAVAKGLAVMGTCAGAILLSKTIVDSDQPRLGILDTAIQRNAYGRQIDSFEADIAVPSFGEVPLRGVFIRAPKFTKVGDDVTVLARFEDAPVVVRQGRHLALTFHPELTGDTRIHELFLQHL